MIVTPKNRRWTARFTNLLLPRVWYVHPPVVLQVQAMPEEVVRTLKLASKPSVERLHLRNLFVDGRRYSIEPGERRFRLTSTTRILGSYRRRSSTTAIMTGRMTMPLTGVTRVELRSRIQLDYMARALVVPVAMASIIVYVPWSPAAIAASIGLLLLLSWSAHRSHAMLDAHAMVWFVRKALEDLTPAEIAALGVPSPDQIDLNQEFESAWELFRKEKGD